MTFKIIHKRISHEVNATTFVPTLSLLIHDRKIKKNKRPKRSKSYK